MPADERLDPAGAIDASIGGSMILWSLTGNPRYKAWAWKAFRATVVVLFVLLALFAIERVLAPIA